MVCWCIGDDKLAPSTEYCEEIATVTQFLSETQPSSHIAAIFTVRVLKISNYDFKVIYHV